MVEVGDALPGVPEDDGLVGRAHEGGVPLVLGVQGDDADAVAVLLVELAHGPDQPHGGLSAVHDSDALEHPSDPLSMDPALAVGTVDACHGAEGVAAAVP